jgi:hypothetical protein
LLQIIVCLCQIVDHAQGLTAQSFDIIKIVILLCKHHMKKFLATILALVYLATSVGTTVHLHYCMDKLVAWSLGKNTINKKSCPHCGMGKSLTDKHCVKESKGCCKDGQKQIKLENDQKITESSVNLAQISPEEITHAYSGYSIGFVPSLTEEYPVTNAPPQTDHVPLFVLNCDYRI